MEILNNRQLFSAEGRLTRTAISRWRLTRDLLLRAGWQSACCLGTAILLVLIMARFDAGQVLAQGPTEDQMKAVFLFNFAKFVEWPSEVFSANGGALVFGVLGDDLLAVELEQTVKGKNINGHALGVRRLKPGQPCNGCQVLFIGANERKRVQQVIENLKGASVLTVGDFEPANANCGIINFVMEQSKVRFVIDAAAAEQVRLRISAKLLALAKNVKS